MRNIIFTICMSLVAFACVIEVSALQDIKITLDTESARATLDSLGKKEIPEGELALIAGLAGNQGLIRQASRFDKRVTDENFKLALKEMVEKGTKEPDTFAFKRLKERLVATRTLLDRIEKNPKELTGEVTQRILKYTPAGVAVDVKVYFIVGGTSDGFAPNSKTFYVALDYFEDDYEGLKLVMAHELFHNVQAAAAAANKQFFKEGAPANVKNSFTLLQNTLKEGTASAIGDPLEVTSGKKYTTWFQGKYRTNLRRIESNFALFDTLLFRLYNDPDADPGKLYNIGFSGMFDSALYFVGYRMTRVLEKHKGKDVITAAINENPVRFFNQYIKLYKEQNDPEAIRFSKSTEEILLKLGQPAQQ